MNNCLSALSPPSTLIKDPETSIEVIDCPAEINAVLPASGRAISSASAMFQLSEYRSSALNVTVLVTELGSVATNVEKVIL